jgi:hypothetical protein
MKSSKALSKEKNKDSQAAKEVADIWRWQCEHTFGIMKIPF